jgi:hypothetical protein
VEQACASWNMNHMLGWWPAWVSFFLFLFWYEEIYWLVDFDGMFC